MRGLEGKARAIGAAAAARAQVRVAAALRERLGDAVNERSGEVTVTGRGAVRRMLADPVLRWVGGLTR